MLMQFKSMNRIHRLAQMLGVVLSEYIAQFFFHGLIIIMWLIARRRKPRAVALQPYTCMSGNQIKIPISQTICMA